MNIDQDGTAVTVLDPTFPLAEVTQIGTKLDAADFCIPGYERSEAGLFQPEDFFRADVEDIHTVLLPDRGVASRMAQLADGRRANADDPTRRQAAELLAFCHCFNIQVEPSIAFHEMAYKDGDAAAAEELRRFRIADSAHALSTVNYALGLDSTC